MAPRLVELRQVNVTYRRAPRAKEDLPRTMEMPLQEYGAPIPERAIAEE
jgi:hypothetical protein